MKPITKSVLAGLLLLTAHSVSFAATYTLHLSGSTAFRASVDNAIVNYLATSGNVYGAYSDTSLTGASEGVFEGTISGGNTLVVETCWTGSAQGIHDTADVTVPPIPSVGGVPLGGVWMSATNVALTSAYQITPATAPAKISGGKLVASPAYDAAVAPDVAMSDVWQASTLFPTPALTETVANGIAVQSFVVCASPGAPVLGSGEAPVTTTSGSYTVGASSAVTSLLTIGDNVGAVSGLIPPFAVVTSIGSTSFNISVPAIGTGSGASYITQSGFSNITAQQLRGLYTNGTGSLPMSVFDGIPSDSFRTVIGIGRSPDSGTRLTMTDESGIDGATSVNGSGQYNQLAQDFAYNGSTIVSDSTTAITSFALTPVTTFNGLTLALGDNGYTSGGTVQKVIDNGSVSAYYFTMVSPLGISDATNAVLGGATALTYNGVAYNSVAVESGEYSLWAYEHMYASSALSTATNPSTNYTLFTQATNIANQVVTSDALVNGDKISNMNVSRHPITDVGGTIY